MNYFDEYVNKYDMNIEEINYKYYHSYRVMDNMELIANNLNLKEKDVELAKCIGILHDIGRFEQFRKYQSFNDKNIDHGNYGEQIIKENNILKHFNIEEEDYEIVYTAIRNHNKYSIESNLKERELLFAKMIRDADKLDILYALGSTELKNIIYEDDSEISTDLDTAFYKNSPLKYSDRKNKNDNIVTLLAYPYDIYFNITLRIIEDNKYYEKIYNRLKNKDKYIKYLDHIKKYIKERVD